MPAAASARTARICGSRPSRAGAQPDPPMMRRATRFRRRSMSLPAAKGLAHSEFFKAWVWLATGRCHNDVRHRMRLHRTAGDGGSLKHTGYCAAPHRPSSSAAHRMTATAPTSDAEHVEQQARMATTGGGLSWRNGPRQQGPIASGSWATVASLQRDELGLEAVRAVTRSPDTGNAHLVQLGETA